MTSGRIAFLWDESFLWGLMACRALKTASLPFDLVRSEDIRKGILREYDLLFVPGGWASNKAKSLGQEGIEEIRRFVHSGGNYLGFCGGAGLATKDGIGLLDISRKPTEERVPSFSGPIRLNIADHPIWENQHSGEKTSGLGTRDSDVFHAWWPSQFVVEDRALKVLATYGSALTGSFSSDLNVGDVESVNGWKTFEETYRINLDPKRLLDEPAVVEGTYGEGKVLLSLVHFDTPGDDNGERVLRNLWKYLAGEGVQAQKTGEPNVKGLPGFRASALIPNLETSVEGLLDLGIRNFLWFWRNPMLLQWRRGVRGLEYCTLYVLVKEIAEILRARNGEWRVQDSDLNGTRELLTSFVEKAKQLLLLERRAMQNGHITYERCDDPLIREMRSELFSSAKSHGGLFKKLLDELDSLLFKLLKQETP